MVGYGVVRFMQKLDGYFEVNVRVEMLSDFLLVHELGFVVVAVQVADYCGGVDPVSYTHLTLPTILLV